MCFTQVCADVQPLRDESPTVDQDVEPPRGESPRVDQAVDQDVEHPRDESPRVDRDVEPIRDESPTIDQDVESTRDESPTAPRAFLTQLSTKSKVNDAGKMYLPGLPTSKELPYSVGSLAKNEGVRRKEVRKF